MFDRPLQVVFTTNEIADVRLQGAFAAGRRMMRRDLAGEVKQIVDLARGRQGPLPLGADRVQVHQSVDVRQVAGHALERRHHARSERHLRGTVAAADGASALDLTAADQVRHHLAQPADLADRRPTHRRRLEALPHRRVAVFVVEAFQHAQQGEERAVAALAGVQFATERRTETDRTIAANQTQHRQVDRRPAVTVDGRIDDKLVLEAVAADLEGAADARSVLAANVAVAVFDLLGAVLLQQTDQFIMTDERGAGAGDSEKTICFVVILDAPAEGVVGGHPADAVEDFLVREVAEDVAGEAETQMEAVPEARGRLERSAVEAHLADLRFAVLVHGGRYRQVLDAGRTVLESLGHWRLLGFIEEHCENLVPKLGLGNARVRSFASRLLPAGKQSFPTCVPTRSVGTRGLRRWGCTSSPP